MANVGDSLRWLCLHTHNRLMALCPGLPAWAGTRKVKPICILLKQETVSGSSISWAVCKSERSSGHITTPAPNHSVFTDWMPFLPPNQQRQSTEGHAYSTEYITQWVSHRSNCQQSAAEPFRLRLHPSEIHCQLTSLWQAHCPPSVYC